MSRLTPNKPLTDAQLEQAIDIIASGQLTYEQVAKILDAVTLTDDHAGYGPNLEDIAVDLSKASSEIDAYHNQPEEPQRWATISREDQPDWMRAFNDLSIRG